MKKIFILLISFVLLLSTVGCAPENRNCTVRFYNGDSELIQTYSVKKGDALTEILPNIPTEKKGNTIYIFDKWGTSLTNDEQADFSKIDVDLDVYAIYKTVKTFNVENAEMGYYVVIENSNQSSKTMLLPLLKGTVIDLKFGGVSITDFIQNEVGVELSEQSVMKILGGKSYGDFVLTLTTQSDDITFLYEIKLAIVTKIIENKKDLESVMSIATEKSEKVTVSGYSNVAVSADGYFVLNNNIDFEGDYFGLTAVQYDVEGFTGIFDGRGYTISNISVKYESEGLFGYISDKGIVRNVAFLNAQNITNNGNASYVRRNIICYVLAGRIENIYVEANRGRIFGVAPFSGAVGQYSPKGIVQNLVVNMTEAADKNYQDYIGTAIGAVMGIPANISSIANVISISRHYDSIGVNPEYDYAQFATEIQTFKSIAAVKGANNQYSSDVWDTEIWNIEGSLPVFKSSNLMY